MAQILVLTDCRTSFETLRAVITKQGHQAWRATSIPEALTFLSDYQIDLIVGAANLETEDIFEFVRMVKSDSDLSQTPVVLCSAVDNTTCGGASETNMSAARSVGAQKFISLSQLDAKQLWLELTECLSKAALRSDALGSRVRTSTLNQWTSQPEVR